MDRHEILRATFSANGQELHIRESLPVRLQAEPVSTDQLAEICRAAAAEPFSLEEGPLFRARLLRTGDGRHTVLFVAHHIIMDGWSHDVLFREWAAAYSGSVTGTAAHLEPACSFSAFAREESNFANGAEAGAIEQYWTGLFAALPAPLQLPTDRPRPALRTYAGAVTRLATEGARDTARSRPPAPARIVRCTRFF